MNAPAGSLHRKLREAASAMNDAAAPPKVKSLDAIRVMLIDDSLTVRTVLKRMVDSDPEMMVTETAGSAERGIAQLANADVDVILLDLEMPGMGGLAALPTILQTAPEAQVMVVSSLTEDGAEATVKALSQGAADTMLKPRPGGFNDDYRNQLLSKIRALGTVTSEEAEQGEDEASNEKPSPARSARLLRRAQSPEVLAIGASTGGIHALNIMLRSLSPDFDLPIIITQHLPSSFIPVFARQIEVASARPTHIADEGTEIRKGEIAVATGHGHLTVRRMRDQVVTKVLAAPAPSGCMPSVDPMLTSLAETYEGRVLAVILSGMGRDGLEGAKSLVSMGGSVWAQDADTSAVWGMPGAVTKAGLTSLVAAPQALGDAIMAEFAQAGRAVAAAAN